MIHRLVDCYLHILESVSNHHVIEDSHVLELWFDRDLLSLLCIGPKSNVRVLCLILARVPVDGVIHKHEELLLHLGLGGGTQMGILSNLQLKPA